MYDLFILLYIRGVFCVCVCRFNVRLMTSGRMKGQAFIGLPSEDIALQAITDTNGYQLKGKPIVVVSFLLLTVLCTVS